MLEKYNTDSFIKDLSELNINLEKRQLCQFLKYYELLVEWNSFMNLTAITEFDQVMKKHFVDSLSLIKAVDLKNAEYHVIDIGTGAGFPGIPLKIAFPNLKITLLDSLNKRVKFLNKVIEELDLKDIDTIHGRAEDYARDKNYRQSFDLCVSRAVANLSTLSEYCLPYVKKGGKFISYKSEKSSDEMDTAKNAIKILGGSILGQTEFYLPDSDIYRNLFIIGKTKETPMKYPRKAGLPSKEPLC